MAPKIRPKIRSQLETKKNLVTTFQPLRKCEMGLEAREYVLIPWWYRSDNSSEKQVAQIVPVACSTRGNN